METQPNPNGARNHNIRLLQTLSPRDVKILIQAEEELSQTKVSKYFAIFVAVVNSFICLKFALRPSDLVNFSSTKEYGRPTQHMNTSSILMLSHIQKS